MIKEILEDYNQSRNRNLIIPDELLAEVEYYFNKEIKTTDLTPRGLAIDIYEELLCDCPHTIYSIAEDEYCSGPDVHGNPTYGTTEYKICDVCGATCPIDNHDEDNVLEGEWERTCE